MRIGISRLGDKGRVKLEEELCADDLDLQAEELKICGPVRVDGWAERKNDVVIVSADITVPFMAECSRCLKEYAFDFKRRVMFDYPVAKSDTAVDITADLRSEIILDYPLVPLCRNDCKGLCPKCGRNLNEGKCGCIN